MVLEVIGTVATKRLFSFAVGLVFATGAVAFEPSPFGSWEPSAGPPGGSIRAFISVDTSLHAGTDHGLYRSSDGGASWQLEDLPLEWPVRALAVIDHTVLAGTFGGGLFRSDDNGAHWTPANEGLPQVPTLYTHAFAVSSGSVFAAVFGGTTYERIYASIDAGRSWSARGPTPPGGIISLVGVGGTLYGGSTAISPKLTIGGVYRSNDRGMTWILTSDSLANESVRVVFFSSGSLIAGTDYNGIYRSLDQGMNWAAGNFISNRSSHSVTSIIGVGSLLYAGMQGEGVFKSGDNGVTWVPTGLTGIEVRCLTSFGSAVYAGTQFGVFESDDAGESWAGRNSGLANTFIPGIYGVWTAGSDVFAHVFEFDQARVTFRNSLYRSADSGRSWTLSGDGLPFDAYVDDLVADGNVLYAGILGVGVYKSRNGEAAWSPAGPGLPVVAQWPYMLAARDGLVLVSVKDQVFRSTDAGTTWSGPSMGLSNSNFVQNMLFAGGEVYGATGQGVVKSLDEGVSWQPTGLTVFTRLIAASAHALYAVVADDSGVLKSTDGGDSWTATALRRNDIYSFAVFGGWLFAANVGNALGAVFFSNDEGASWTTADQNLFVLGGVALAVSDKALFAGTQGNGVQTLILLPDRASIRPPLHTVGPRSVPIRR
jgi:photosystem II stability/assembly factor-like uncharacterized protein